MNMDNENSELINKTCKVCGENRLIKYFWRNPQYADGFDSRCKICRREGRKQPKKGTRNNSTPKHLQSMQQIIKLTFVTKDDFMCMWDTLEKMGYDIHNKDKSVHEQFVDKWNGITGSDMTYKKKTRPTVNLYLPDGSENPEYFLFQQHKKKT
jgi:hypothetical protein